MVEIYNKDGGEITVGLQSHTVCDEAIIAAKSLAAQLDEEMYLEDGDERFTVWPSGEIEDGWEGDWD